MFGSVLVANRGEIAVRIMRTLRQLGIRSVGVYSDADAGALHTRRADHSVHIGPAAAAESYLSIERLIDAAVATGAEAVHPGYGFLSENPAFARAVVEAGLVWIGPPPEAIEAMGDKIRAKQLVAAHGVPVVPGRLASGMTDTELIEAAREVGLPVLLKPSAGGGGKGMFRVDDNADLAAAIASARRTAQAAFGDDTLLVERYVERPRHIEIQVLADTHGDVVHLGERECSLQRRHQKIIEEAPSPLLSPEQRQRMGALAVDVARSCGYVNAGTVEFIVPGGNPDECFFMEMNTRLQVEHPVTEEIYGIDLVELQLRVAAGEALPWSSPPPPSGHAVEARVYAEDPSRGFLPTGGRVLAVAEGGEGRFDSGIALGSLVTSDYDPMLLKVIAHGPDRASALAQLDRDLAALGLAGLEHNGWFLRRLLALPEVHAGELDTGLVERRIDELTADDGAADVALLAAAIDATRPLGTGAWQATDGWRHGGPSEVAVDLLLGGTAVTVGLMATERSSGDTFGWVEAVGSLADGPVDPSVGPYVGQGAASGRIGNSAAAPLAWTRSYDEIELWWAGRHWVVSLAPPHDRGPIAVHPDEWWVDVDGRAFHVTRPDPFARRRGPHGGGSGEARSPMPGKVVSVAVTTGDPVVVGQPLATVEAMKMEHTVVASVAGTVTEVHVTTGQQVALDAPLVTVTPS